MWSWLRQFKYVDIPLALTSGILVILGLTLLYGTSRADSSQTIFHRQLLFAVIGVCGYVGTSYYSYQSLAKANRWWYVLLLPLLIYLLTFARSIRGSSRWIDVGFFNFQPGEFAKIVVILGLSRWLYLRRGEINSWKNIAITALYTAIPGLLIMLEPDLGSTIVIVGVWAGILTVSWVNRKYLAGIVLAFVLVSGIGWQFFLKDFQKQRIEVFLDPSLDPRGRGYNVRQATIAVGSGQWFGRGLGRGLQSQLKFLPERQTDFIFATTAEEIGFVGCSGLLVLYAIVLFRIWRVALHARDELGKYIASGVFFMLLVQVMVNIGMNIGLLPVTGIPLPLLSYGGSSFIVVCISLGIVQNIALQSKALRF